MREKKEVKFNRPATLMLLVLWAIAATCIGILSYDLFVKGVAFASHGSHWLMAINIILTIVLTATAPIFEKDGKEAEIIET